MSLSSSKNISPRSQMPSSSSSSSSINGGSRSESIFSFLLVLDTIVLAGLIIRSFSSTTSNQTGINTTPTITTTTTNNEKNNKHNNDDDDVTHSTSSQRGSVEEQTTRAMMSPNLNVQKVLKRGMNLFWNLGNNGDDGGNNGGRLDFIPIWMGSFWLFWRQQQQQSQNRQSPLPPPQVPISLSSSLASWFPLIVDSLGISLLLTYRLRSTGTTRTSRRTTKERDTSVTDGKSNDENDTTISLDTNHQRGIALEQQLKARGDTTTTMKNNNIKKKQPSVAVSQASNNDATHTSSSSSSNVNVSPPLATTTTTSSSSGRYIEILVHNVSHTDLVLSLNAPPLQRSKTPSKGNTNTYANNNNNNNEYDTDDDLYCLCRPRFSAFDGYSQRVLDALLLVVGGDNTASTTTTTTSSSPSNNNTKRRGLKESLISFPRYERSDATRRYDIKPKPVPAEKLPIGFSLSTTATAASTTTTTQGSSSDTSPSPPNKEQTILDKLVVTPEELNDLRLRGRDAPRVLKEIVMPSSSAASSSLSPLVANGPNTAETLPPVFLQNPSNPQLQCQPRQQTFQHQDTNYPLPTPQPQQPLQLNAVFFPLLASLLPRWHSQLEQKYCYGMVDPSSSSSSTATTSRGGGGTKIKKVLILVSGVGTPRNWTHSIAGNSTQKCADLMQLFIETLYPDITVIQIHSETNIFRYDENIVFVQRELMPCIQYYRDAHAKGLPYPDEIQQQEQQEQALGGRDGVLKRAITDATTNKDLPFSTEWKKSFAITLSFADGSPARNHAIQAALRSYKPTYFHFWQLKTFWHESKIVDSDIEVHSFEEMETLPAIETSKLIADTTNNNDDYVQDSIWILQQVVEEMKAFKEDMAAVLADRDQNSNDINSFWLRKTHKPVLAILAVQGPRSSSDTVNGVSRSNIQFLRGTNMEVSMPTGSLCAERNVIGTALAQNPRLRRQDLKMIAVLAVPPPQPSSPQKQQQQSHTAGSYSFLPPSSSTSSKSGYQQSNYQKIVADMKRSSSMTSIVIDESWEDDGQTRRHLHIPRQPTGSVTPTDGLGPAMPPALSLPPVLANMTTMKGSTSTNSPAYQGVMEPLMPTSSGEDDWVLHDATSPTSVGTKSNHTNTTTKNAPLMEAATLIGRTPPAISAPQEDVSFVLEPPPLPPTDGTTTSKTTNMVAVPQSPARRIALYNAPPSTSATTTSTTTTTTSAAGGRCRSSSLSSYSPVLSGNSFPDSSKPTMGSAGTRKHKRTVVVHSAEDINPLRPCGACNEWLKKIAESNPYFQIVTFTDADCNGIYCTPCSEE